MSSVGRADLVLRGGRVWPGKGLAGGTAIAVRHDRVLAVGDDAAMRELTTRATRIVELEGRLVVPGFNDAHVHFLEAGFGLLSVDLRDTRDQAELAARIGEHARTLSAGTWIRNGYWDHETWPSRALPTRQAIDAVTPEHPVFVSRLDGHLGLANSVALHLAGITRSTLEPAGGSIVRDVSGEPTGILKDAALDLVKRVIPEPSAKMNRRAARAALAEAARYGVTTIQDNSAADALPAYLELRERGELSARLCVWRNAALLEDLRRAGVRSGLGDDWVRIGALKILVDGSLGSRTAAFFDPYADDPETRGLLLYPVEELGRLVRDADAAGFQLAVHAIGDRAASLALDALDRAVQANGPRERRFRIEHAQVVRQQDVARLRSLGVIASVQPSHCIDDMRWAETRLGAARCRDAYRMRSLLEAGIPLAFGTDWFVEPLDPRLGLYAAVARERPEGGPDGGWFPDEKISLEDALDAYTRGSAFAELTEKHKGTLAAGCLADLVVFGRDLFAITPAELLTASIDLTVVGGRIVHDRKK
jgi:predicted amidohydrolase YtcJ